MDMTRRQYTLWSHLAMESEARRARFIGTQVGQRVHEIVEAVFEALSRGK